MVNYNSYNQAKDIQAVSDIIGAFGIWHINLFLFQTIHSLYLPVFNHGLAFYDIDTTYACTSGNETINSEFSIDSFNDELGFERQKCGLLSSECDLFHFNISNAKYESSLIKSLDLACEKTDYRYFVASSYQLGCLVSIILYFIFCKRFGRACLIRLNLSIELLATVAIGFVFNFYGQLVARFFLGIGSFGCFFHAFILLMEIVSKQIRPEICVLVQFGWTIGNIVLALIMSFVIFNYVQIERFLIVIQAILLIWSLFLRESPKWLLLNGYYNEAEKALSRAGKNFDKLTNYEIKIRLMLLREHLIEQEINQKSIKNRSKSDLKLIIKAFSLIFTWFVCKLIYFTISYYPEMFTRKIGHFLEQNVLYQSFVELFAFVLTYLLIRFVSKRIYILVFALFFVIISIFGELLFFKFNYFEENINDYSIKLTFMLVIKFGVSLVIQFLLLFTVNENHLHQKIYGYSMIFGFIGSGLASFIPLIIEYYSFTATLIVLGLLAIFNLFAVIWMPELVRTSTESTNKISSNPKRLSDLTNIEGSVEFSFKIEE